MYTSGRARGAPSTYEVLRESTGGELEVGGKKLPKESFQREGDFVERYGEPGESDFFGSPLELRIFAAVAPRARQSRDSLASHGVQVRD